MAFTQREPIGVVIAVSAFNHLAVLGAAWFITADGQESGNPARADQNIPERKPVDKLKPVAAKAETEGQDDRGGDGAAGAIGFARNPLRHRAA